jgi:hypothetical protein
MEGIITERIIQRKPIAGTALVFRICMRSILFCLFLVAAYTCSAQLNKGAYRVAKNDTTHYFVKLSFDNPFTIDSITLASTGQRINFFDENTKGRACSSIVCNNPSDVMIRFEALQSLNPLKDQKRTALNSQIQPTSDYQKGVVIYTRHGKTFKRIAISTFTETAPGDPNLTPSVLRGPAISGDR